MATAPPANDVRAPWMRDIDSKSCLACKAEFGIITKRRHHCRYCGGLFCSDCSDHKPKGVPGYENEEVRVCDICYYNDMAFLVVYNLMFSGFHAKIFPDRQQAVLCYSEIPEYASRILVKMGSAEVVSEWYCRDTWKHRIVNYTNGQLQKYVKPRVALYWIPPRQQQQEVFAFPLPPPPQQSQAAQQPLAPSPSQSQPRAAPASDAVRAVLVLFRQIDAEATDHWWAFDGESSFEELLADAIREMERIPNLGYGAVLDLSGTVHKLFRNPTMFGGPQAAFEKSLQLYLAQLSAVCAWHEEGEYRSNYFPTVAQAQQFAESQAESVVVLDHNGCIILAKNCSRSWREGLAKFAGGILLARQQLTAVIVCTAMLSRSSRSCTVRVYDNIYQAEKQLVAEKASAMFGVPAGGPSAAVLLRRNPHLPKDAALGLAADAAAACRSGAEGTSANDGSSGAVDSPLSGAQSNTAPIAAMPECQICFIAFNPGPNKPCLCGACGNSVCYTCIRSMSHCAFCRKEINPNGPVITNVQLLQLISGVSD